MPRTCLVCAHKDRAGIDRALVSGQPLRETSALFRVSEDSLARHRDAHIPKAVAKAQEVEDVAQALDVVKQLKTINGVTMQILSEARQQRNPEVALKAVDRIQKQIELQAKLLGELDERPQINVVLSPEWLSLRVVIVQALAPFPEAQRAVVGALSASVGASR